MHRPKKAARHLPVVGSGRLPGSTPQQIPGVLQAKVR